MAANTSTGNRKSSGTRWIAIAAVVVLLVLVVRHFTSSVVLIRTATVQRQDLINTLPTNGIVEPQQNFEAHSPMAGTVKAVYVHPGEMVAKGKLLLAMDDSAAQAQVAAALAALRTAQAQTNAFQQGGTRLEQLQLAANTAKARTNRDQLAATLATLTKLEQSGSASPNEVSDAKNQLAMANITLHDLELQKTQPHASVDQQRVAADLANAQAAYQAAQDTLQQEIVRAPFQGTVYSIPVKPSEYVQAGDTLLKLADLTHIQILGYFDEPEIGRLSVGQRVSIFWNAKPNRTWHGHVVRTPSNIIGYGTRHVGEAIIAVDDSDGVLIPNTNVTLNVLTMRENNVLTVPREALHPDGNNNFVYQIVGDRLRRVPIQIGAENLTMVQVLSGIDEHAAVALSAPDGTSLRNGMKVRNVQ
ncbi:MAG TPA: efflux RND transporter periplasmic adaptor subunit [Acidobacteriaceae bacterium]|jgi:HlyD family secretion protein|nr:efflux RND transporter periplasmic adaptor subunit [Acidobacteriaceae bacterium]